MDELELRRRLQGLAAEQPPQRELWPGIESRLRPRSSGRTRSRPWAIAAGMLLTTGLLWLSLSTVPGDGDETPRPAVAATAPAAAEDAADTLLVAWSELLEIERQHRGEWRSGPGTNGTVERWAAVREIDTSLIELASALLLEPESQLLRRLMHQTLQQRIALSRDALKA